MAWHKEMASEAVAAVRGSSVQRPHVCAASQANGVCLQALAPLVARQDGINGVYLGRDVVQHAGSALSQCLRKVSKG